MAYPSFPAPTMAWDMNIQAPAAILGLMPVAYTGLQQGFADYEATSENFTKVVPMTATGQLVLPVIDRLYVPRLWVDDVELQPVVARSIGISAQPYVQGFAIDRFLMEDAGPQVGNFIEGVFVEVGHSIRAFPDLLVAEALASLRTTTYYDGADYASTSHPIDPEQPSVGSWSNLLPYFPLTRENLWKALATFMQIPGKDGLPWSNRRKGIKLVVPSQLYPIAINAVRSTLMATAVSEPGIAVSGVASENNTFLKMAVDDVVVLQTLTDQTTWYLVDTASASLPPVVIGMREPFHIVPRISPTDPVVWGNHQFLWNVQGRMSAALTLAQNILVATSGS